MPRVREPAFGRRRDLAEPHVTAVSSRIMVVGLLLDELVQAVRKSRHAVDRGLLAMITKHVCQKKQ